MKEELNSSPKWTIILIAACIVTYILQNISSSWVYFAFFPAFASKAPWMFITSIFLHADVSHLFFNMLALLFFGTSLERMVGRQVFLLLFFLSGVVGNLGYMVTASNPYVPSIGASGSIYGVVGALATLAPFMIVYIYGMLPVPMIFAAVIWGFLDFAGLFAPSGIAHGAHLGGMFIGVLFGLYVRIMLKRMYGWEIHYQ
ncbi:rhomboid family intramembrane serine protease [Candidatus Bathyarchaeota archaeon]|nr:rhomboid family intramembrane serine protease [Candidatus Bathyarchaeota archaeon]